MRTESPFDLLERVKKVATEWVKSGHRNGSNTHNVSATISLKEEDWELAGEWMWTNKEHYNGLSVLPYNGGTYSKIRCHRHAGAMSTLMSHWRCNCTAR